MNIIIIGYGKMGHEVEKVALSRNHQIAATIDTPADWSIIENKKIDVAIEFSTPATAVENIRHCFELNIPVVCGTTGWYAQLPELEQICISEGKSLFHAPNFSIGMNITFILNRQLDRFAQKYGYDMQLSETHHIHKLDKPSGTAIKIANDIIGNDDRYTSWTIDKPADKSLFIDVHREGEVFGIHEIEAQSACDRITLRHEAFSRQGFATGAVIAAEFLFGKKGCFTMSDLLEQ